VRYLHKSWISLKQYLEEGKVLYICNACVERAKPGNRAVDAPYILKLSMRTQIFEGNSNDTSFPKYIFSLTQSKCYHNMQEGLIVS
jgi:replication factor A1